MKKAVALICLFCFALLCTGVLSAPAAEKAPGEDELYECSSEKTVFQNLRNWFGIWGKGLFKSSTNQTGTEKEKTLKRNVQLKEQGIPKAVK